MATTKGINSYVTLEEAEAYFENRLDVAAWVDAPETEKHKALTTATNVLEGIDWIGSVISDEQTLAFPRYGTYLDPRLGKAISMNAIVPNRIVKAQLELAYHLLNNDGLLDNTGSVKNLTLGPLDLQNIRAPSKVPSAVKSLIRPLELSRGANSWWRAN